MQSQAWDNWIYKGEIFTETTDKPFENAATGEDAFMLQAANTSSH